MRCHHVASALSALLLAGCSLGPELERPVLDIPDEHRFAAPPASPETLAELPWWELFLDPPLQGLIAEALERNHDLRVAAARVALARAFVGSAHSELLPQVEVGIAGSRQKLSGTADPTYGINSGRTVNTWQGGASVSWELDLFGALSQAEDAALADFFGAENVRQGVVQALVADVAAAYFDLCELDLLLLIAERTAETRRGTLDLFEQRLLGGVGTRLDTSTAEADLAEALARIPELEAAIAFQENFLCLLLGRNPGPIERGAALEDQYQPPTLPPGLPSDLLTRRPDLRAADDALMAAAARVGVARSNYFPRLALTGFFGGLSGDFEDLADADSGVWSVGGSLLTPVFQGGRLDAEHDAAMAVWEETRAVYERTAQNAFREVADAIIAIDKLVLQRVERERRVAVLVDALELSRARYESGFSSYLEVLDSDRQLFAAANDLARTKARQLTALVQLYRALGGGWDAPVTEDAASEDTADADAADADAGN